MKGYPHGYPEGFMCVISEGESREDKKKILGFCQRGIAVRNKTDDLLLSATWGKLKTSQLYVSSSENAGTRPELNQSENSLQTTWWGSGRDQLLRVTGEEQHGI